MYVRRQRNFIAAGLFFCSRSFSILFSVLSFVLLSTSSSVLLSTLFSALLSTFISALFCVISSVSRSLESESKVCDFSRQNRHHAFDLFVLRVFISAVVHRLSGRKIRDKEKNIVKDDRTLYCKDVVNISIVEKDLTHTDSYKKIVDTVSEKVNGAGLNVLFNNAGISSKFTRLGLVKKQQMTDAFLINTVAPIMLTKAFLPLLKVAAKNAEDKTRLSVTRAAIVNMTSILGSIAENIDGGFYPYRCSKAALNAATKSMSMDLKADGILVVCVHPGWVRTNLGGSSAPMDVDSSVSHILETLDSLTERHTGSFIQYDGKILPW